MDGVASLRIGWDEVRPHVPRVITFDKLSKLREAVTHLQQPPWLPTTATALPRLRQSQPATGYLVPQRQPFAQHWGVAARKP
jgi:hypothetical protein